MKKAAGIQRALFPVADYTNSNLTQPERVLRSRNQLTPQIIEIHDELRSLLAMKQDVINYFTDLNVSFNSMNGSCNTP